MKAIVRGVPTNVEAPYARHAIERASIYAEYVGGMGDAILRMYFSGKQWHEPLESLGQGQTAAVALMCHNPHFSEMFRWHPNRERIDVLDLGFDTPFHPWENKEWRLEHGLPAQAPCPPHAISPTLRFYPAPEDKPVLDKVRRGRYIIMAATAGTEERTIPSQIREQIAEEATGRGYSVVVVGRSRYFHGVRARDLAPREGVIDTVDLLTVPGVAEAVKTASGVVTAHSAVLHMAWHESRPVFLLYNDWMKKNLLPHGPVGYMQGIGRADTDHMEFTEYGRERFARWIGGR